MTEHFLADLHYGYELTKGGSPEVNNLAHVQALYGCYANLIHVTFQTIAYHQSKVLSKITPFLISESLEQEKFLKG